MISWAVCALMPLAFLLEAAWLAITANTAGVGLMTVLLGDPDGDVVPAVRFGHVSHSK